MHLLFEGSYGSRKQSHSQIPMRRKFVGGYADTKKYEHQGIDLQKM